MTDILAGQPYRVVEGDCLASLRELPDGQAALFDERSDLERTKT